MGIFFLLKLVETLISSLFSNRIYTRPGGFGNGRFHLIFPSFFPPFSHPSTCREKGREASPNSCLEKVKKGRKKPKTKEIKPKAAPPSRKTQKHGKKTLENRTKSRNEHSSCWNLWILVYDTTVQGKGEVIHREFREFQESRRQRDESKGAFPEGFFGDLKQERSLVPRERSSWKRPGKGPKPLPQSGIWEQLSHFSFRKRVLPGIWGIPSQSWLFWNRYSFAKGKISFFPPFLLIFSSFFPALFLLLLPQECPAACPSLLPRDLQKFQEFGIGFFPTKLTRNIPKREKNSRKNKEKPTKKVDFAGKASLVPSNSGNSWEAPGGSQNSDRESQIPPKSNIPGGIPAGFGILPAWIPIPAGSGIIPIPIPIPSFPRTPGRARGGFMYTAPTPGSEPIPRADPGIPGMLKFLGTLSCLRGQSWNSGNAEIPGNARLSLALCRARMKATPEFWECRDSHARGWFWGDPGNLGTPQFLGTLSCPRGQFWNSRNSRIPGNLSSPRSAGRG